MPNKPVLIQLTWDDPTTGTPHHSVCQSPVAIGREIAQMPDSFGNQPVSHLELDHKQVSRYHALINVINQQLQITDKSANGTFLNGRPVRQDSQIFTIKDTVRIGPFKITVELVKDRETNATELSVERSYMAKTQTGTNPNAIAVWLIGGLVLALLGWGTWAIAQLLLKNARPTVESSIVVPHLLSERLESSDSIDMTKNGY
ncbi:MAG: FHA domain-containing protein [Cyanobacteria bacterium P01_F01_bin.150]